MDTPSSSGIESGASRGPAGPALARASHSRFVQRVRRRWEGELPLLPAGVPKRASIDALIDRLQQEGRSLPSAMRVARQLVIERLAVLDVERGATLEDVTTAMTELAEVTLNRALAEACAVLDTRFGVPRNDAGTRIDFWVVGMGKLGARELNVSSDIDLVYVYEEGGFTDGAEPISAHEYFSHLARSLYTLIGDANEDGFVFRVDLALRPNGHSGPPVVSLSMLEEYLQVQGREWERFAWLKSRVVAPRRSVEDGRALALRGLVTAFVYRRYLDYGVFEGLRQLHAKVRDEAQRRAAGRPERANDVKLSRGGIREIEFIVQLLLVVRGGQFPEMRTALDLERPREAGGRRPDEAGQRRAARRCIHVPAPRRAPHPVPRRPADAPAADPGQRPRLDRAQPGPRVRHGRMRAARPARRAARVRRDRVRRAAARRPSSVGGAKPAAAAGPADRSPIRSTARPSSSSCRPSWRRASGRSPSSRGSPAARRQQAAPGRLVTRAAHAVSEARCTLAAALLFVDWIEPLLRRESYLALLIERPEVQNRLLRLLGLARWPMRYLMLHPA
jgi:glutamate-ammonia-ligase adenylyltransferase